MTIRAVAAALAVSLVMLAGCDSDRRAISRDDLPDVPDEPDVVITVDRAGFDVDQLRVETDDLVEFVIDVDEARITARSPAVALIDTGVLRRGESTFLILDQPGTYELHLDDEAEPTLVIESVEPETAR